MFTVRNELNFSTQFSPFFIFKACSRKGQFFLFYVQFPTPYTSREYDVTVSFWKFLPLDDAKLKRYQATLTVLRHSLSLAAKDSTRVVAHSVNAKRAFHQSCYSSHVLHSCDCAQCKRHKGKLLQFRFFFYVCSTVQTAIGAIYSRTCVKVQLTLLGSLIIPTGNK